METKSCAKCDIGPANIEGHDELFVHSFVGQNVMLKCRACNRLWTRKYGDKTQFEWSPGEPGQGALVPSAP